MLTRRLPDTPIANMVERMLEHAGRDLWRPLDEVIAGDFALALDVTENDAAFIIVTSLPGVNADDIHLNLHDGILTIAAEMRQETNESTGKVLMQERRYGKFSRSIRFPVMVNGEGIEADYNNGVLTVTVPKAAEAQPRRITVKKNS
jgi:HSP20 family protein